MVWRCVPGVPVWDMEMWQFHRPAIAGAGVLVTEAAAAKAVAEQTRRALYGRYAPNAKRHGGS